MSDKISFSQWLRMRPVQRQVLLNTIDEASTDDLFDNIAPELRIPNPNQIDHYEQIQRNYETICRTSPTSSTSSLLGNIRGEIRIVEQNISEQITSRLDNQAETIQEQINAAVYRLRDVLDERNVSQAEIIQQLRNTQDQLRSSQDRLREELEELRMNQPMEPSSEIMTISRQSLSVDQILEPYGQIMYPRYDVFHVIDDYNHTLHRFFIQPAHHGDYEEVITHFLDRDTSPISRLLEGAYVSLTFHCFIDGVQRNFTFREFPDSSRSLLEHIEEVYGDGYGSDIIRNIRHNIMAISVNLVRPYSGGVFYSSSIKYLELFDPKPRYYNSCFYACVREIWKTVEGKRNKIRHITYEKMRIMLTGSPDDKEVSVNKLNEAEKIFGIKFIVLGEQPPKVSYIKRAERHKPYKDLRIIYSIEYDTLYYKGSKVKLVERSDNKVSFNRINNIAYVEINEEKYYLLCLHNNHYSIIRSVIRPTVCEKCGSDKHNAIQALNNASDKLECLENLQDILTRDEYKKESPEPILVFFDVETVNVDGILQAYSIFWKYKDNNEMKEGFLTGLRCEEKFVALIQKIKRVKVLIGYNSSRFDNYFIIKALIKTGVHLDSKNCIIHKNQILKINLKTLKTWDLCQFTKCSLNDACKAYEVGDQKLEYNHDDIQKLFELYKWKFLEIIGLGKIREYNKQDVLLLEKLFYKIHKELYSITNVDPLTTMTLSQLAYTHMIAENREQGIEFIKIPMKYDEIFSSLPAGRVQMWKTGKLSAKEYVQVDINGLYVFICLNNVFPNGQTEYVEEYSRYKTKEHLYICECIVDQSKARIKLCGVKTKGERISWTEEFVKVWLWKEEIEEIENNSDYCIQYKGKTLIWPDKIKPFINMEVYKSIRMEEKQNQNPNKIRDNNAKALGNSTTGKTIQKNRNDEWTIVNNLAEAELFKQRYKNVSFDVTDIPQKYIMMGEAEESPFINKPRHIGCRIYALARLYMYQFMKQIDTILYMDTDGFILEKSELYKIPLNKELGQFKIETEGDILYLASLKNYCIYNSNTQESKFRLKGYKEGDPWYVLGPDEKQIHRDDRITVQMYEYLVNKDYKVMTSTSKIIKKFVKKDPSPEHPVATYRISTLHLQCEERLIV
jgi:uncharacterized protein YprB with RNaseH-like and TPR domain